MRKAIRVCLVLLAIQGSGMLSHLPPAFAGGGRKLMIILDASGSMWG